MKGIQVFLGNMRKTIEERGEGLFFFRGELEDRGETSQGEKKKESSGRILVDFLNEIQKKIIDMEITFPGGTSKGRMG